MATLRCQIVVAAADEMQAIEARDAFEAMRTGDLVLADTSFGRDQANDYTPVDFIDNDFFVEFAVRDLDTVRAIVAAAATQFPGAEVNAQCTDGTCIVTEPGKPPREYTADD